MSEWLLMTNMASPFGANPVCCHVNCLRAATIFNWLAENDFGGLAEGFGASSLGQSQSHP